MKSERGINHIAPEGWTVTKFGEVLTLQRGYDLPNAQRKNGSIPVIGSNGVVGYHNEKKVDGPGVVIGRSGTLGKVYFVKEDFWPLNTSLYVKKFNSIDPKFAYYFLQRLNFKQFHAGTSVPTLNRNLVHPMTISIPSNIAEQLKIAEILSTVDTIIKKSEEIIQRIRSMKKAMMNQLLTKGIGHTKFKQTEIGEIPEEWNIAKLGENMIAEIVMGQSPPSSSYNEDSEGLPFLQGNADFGETYPNPTTYTTNPIKISLKDDILISVRAPVGEVNLSPFKCCIGRGLSAIRTNPQKLHYLFAFYYVKHTATKLHALSTGSTFKAIKKSDLENYVIPTPSLATQQKIVSILSEVDKKIEFEIERKSRFEQIKKGLMNDLLTGKKRLN